ncbi:MAG: spore cortex-lytic enzyme [Bacillota bacterium]|nr:spore cortex-lytic enzyme [Bacillota bacterium]
MFSNVKKAKAVYRFIIFVLLNIAVILFARYMANTNAVDTALRTGSSGEQVRQVQTRLRNWGYYKGAVDGIYGSKTRSAVIYFQKKNGLTPDGIVGKQTFYALGINANTGSTSSNNNINLLAKIISAEARGEPYRGQVAVGAVIMNRVDHPSFPNTLAGVIYQPGAFTAIVDGQINVAVTESAYRAARDALNGVDPTYGCIYYYNPATATNSWIRSRPIVTRIGKHVFCR